jgi:hypothetical protein
VIGCTVAVADEVMISNPIIGYRQFVDGTCRPIYADDSGQYALRDDGERVYGVWLIPEEEFCDLPIIFECCLDP